MLGHGPAYRHICASCAQGASLGPRSLRRRSKSTLPLHNLESPKRSRRLPYRRIYGENTSASTGPTAWERRFRIGKDGQLSSVREVKEVETPTTPVLGRGSGSVSAKDAAQKRIGHAKTRLKGNKPYRHRSDRPKSTKIAPEDFPYALKLAVEELEHARNSTWFGVVVGYNREDERHRNAIQAWFSGMRRFVRAFSESDSQEAKKQDSKLYERLERAWRDGGHFKLSAELRFSITDQIAKEGTLRSEIIRQAQVADARYPAEWYPNARSLSREIHLHIGPTNSGKTYHALQRLMKARSGIYAGPLRLLAHEVYGRLVSAGRSCHLVTGDERIMSADPECEMSSSTVEMVPLKAELDVAVIDEIQMLGDSERGWAWTNAFFGLQASEIHLCGEVRSLPLIKALAASTGEKVIIHEYKRLSPLSVAKQGLGGDLTKVQPGDCLVAFSRAKIHKFAHELTAMVPGKVAVIYGSLPPDTRAGQARLFNDPSSDYDIIVASNAIGMGLNLNIRRIIFSDISKFDGSRNRRLQTTDVKQIGGRAGRYRIAPSLPSGPPRLDVTNPENKSAEVESNTNQGIVTTLWDEDLPFVRAQMDREPAPLRTAGLQIPDEIIIKFAAYFPPSTPLSYILLRLKKITRLSGLYRLCSADEILIADSIQPVTGLKLEERLVICAAPAETEDDALRAVLVELAKCVASGLNGDLLRIESIPLYVLDDDVQADLRALGRLERLHKALTLYIWLAFRFESVFVSGALAAHARQITESKITATLAALAETGKPVVKSAKQQMNDDAELIEDDLVDELEGNKDPPESTLEPGVDIEEEGVDEQRLREEMLRDLVAEKEHQDFQAMENDPTQRNQ